MPPTGPEKRIRAGAKFEKLSQEARNYVSRAEEVKEAKARDEAKFRRTIIWAFVGLFGLVLTVGLGLIVARGMGNLPGLTNAQMDQIMWVTFGDVVVLLAGLLKIKNFQ